MKINKDQLNQITDKWLRGSRLVFIVGSGRCGTTLLKNILNRHPDIGVVPELQFFKLVMAKHKKFRNLKDKKQREVIVDKIIHTVTNIWFLPDQLENFDIDKIK